MERDGDEPLLGAVVQVPLDAPPLGVARGDDPRARIGQVAHRAAQVGDVADDRDDLVGAGRSRSHLELALLAQVGAEGVLDRRELPLLERGADAVHQPLGDVCGQQLVGGRADDLVGRVRELRRVAADLEVGAVGPQPQEQVGQCVEQRLVACLDRCGNPFHAAIVVGGVAAAAVSPGRVASRSPGSCGRWRTGRRGASSGAPPCRSDG